jgi:hypothetical protein
MSDTDQNKDPKAIAEKVINTFLGSDDYMFNDDFGPLEEAITAALVAYGETKWEGWSPTSDNINKLPEPLRQYIHDLETRCDPAGELKAKILAEDERDSLRAENERLRGYLERAGWGPCNIPACNCNGWHQLRETRDERELKAESDSLRTRIAELEEAMQIARESIRRISNNCPNAQFRKGLIAVCNALCDALIAERKTE